MKKDLSNSKCWRYSQAQIWNRHWKFSFSKGEKLKKAFLFLQIKTRSYNSLVTWHNTSCLRTSIVTCVAWKCWLVMNVFYSLYKPGWLKCFCKLRIVWFMSFVLFVIWEIISQGPIKPWTFSHRSQVIFKDWLLLPVMNRAYSYSMKCN